MGYENDPYRDEDGEALMDYDDIQSDREQSPEHRPEVPEDDLEDWDATERSQTPVYDNDKVKPKKRLIKKSGSGKESAAAAASELLDEDDGGFQEEDEGMERKKRLKLKEKFKGEKKYTSRGDGGSGSKSGRKGTIDSGRLSAKDREVDEMWTHVGANDEEDREPVRNMEDDDFIDDTGVDPADRYASDHEQRSPRDAPEAEEGEDDDEIQQLFKVGKKRKKSEKSPAEIALLVENVMAELEVTAEEDAELNRQGKPAINKLRKLPLLTEVLSKKQLQQEFLDHGVLKLLKDWLEPLPDGSLPNINIREAILRILTDFPLDLEQYDRKEQLKKSGLGKVIMFFSKSDEETSSNRKLARDLVDKWSRPIFNKSTRFEDMRSMEQDRAPYRRPPVKKPSNQAPSMDSRDGDLNWEETGGRKSGQSSSNSKGQPTTRPEAAPLDFLVRPQSKIDPDEVRARAKQVVHDERRIKMNKRMQQLKSSKKKQLQATKLSVEGRGMLKYL
jgi:transcription factor SPN1